MTSDYKNPRKIKAETVGFNREKNWGATYSNAQIKLNEHKKLK